MGQGMADVDVAVGGEGRLARRALSDATLRELGLDPADDAAETATDPADPEPPARRRRSGSPARRGRLAVGLLVLAVAVAGPLLARAGVSEARTEVRAQAAERSGAAEELASVEAAERAAEAEEAAALDLAAQARAAHDEQRERLAALDLTEETIDAFLDEVTANAELVEFWRDRTVGDVDRQAHEIPEMQECIRVATQALNRQWNSATFGDSPPPAPSELCRALLAAGT